MEPLVEENQRLRRHVRDLVALSMLPAVWVGFDSSRIVASLAEALLRTLDLDLVYYRFTGRNGTALLECVCTPRQILAGAEAARIGRALGVGTQEGPPRAGTAPHPLGTGELSTLATPLGHAGQRGTLVACSRRPGFPSTEDSLLVQFAMNQAVIALQHKEAEESERAQREQLRVTLASIGDAVIVTDAEGRVTSLNAVAESLTGWPQARAVGQALEQVFDIVNEVTGEPAESPVAQVLRAGTVVGLANHTVLVARDGARRPIDDSAAPIRDAQGHLAGVVLVFRDVTERRRAEEAVREESRIVATLHRLGSRLAAELDLQRLVQMVTDEARQLADAEFGAFFYNVRDDRGESYTLYTLSGAPREAFASFPLPRNTAVFEPTFRGAGIVRLDDVTRDPRYGQNPPYHGMPSGHLPVHSYLAVPVVSRSGEVLGGLFFGHSQVGRFGERHERLVAGLAAQAAIAIDNAQLYRDLQESEQRFRELSDSMPQIVWAARPDGFIDYYNARWYEFTGYPRDAFGDPSWKPILHPDDVQRCQETYSDCIRTGRPYQIEYRFRDYRTGGYRWFLGRAYPVRDAQGRIVRWFGTCTDIDDTKRAEQTTRFLAEASATLAALVDYESTLQKVAGLAVPHFADWCIVDMVEPGGALRRLAVAHMDPARVELAEELRRRYPPRSTDPAGPTHVLHTGQPELVTEIPDDLLAASAYDAEHLQILRDLGLRSYLCVPLVVRSRIIGVLTFITSESGRRYGETDLRLAEELAYRAAVAIDNARLFAEVKDADRRKDEFLATLSHELRNPLAPIRNTLQVLKMRDADAAVVSMMERQVNHLVRLVDDLLDISRILRGKVTLQKAVVDVATVVARAAEIAQPAIDAHGHVLSLSLPSGPLLVEGDEVRLAQVLSNLLHNASRYSDQPGRIWLSAAREADQVVLRVKDEGSGIPADALERIFELFAQVDRAIERKQGGLGIGLTLCRRLVELHGGTIRAQSEGPGKGSEFIVYLPALPEASQPGEGAGPGREAAPGVAPRRVLCVDDNVDACTSLALLVQLMGHTTDVAHDGLEAVEKARAFRPDVIFLDIGLPGLNGYLVCQRLRQEPEFAHTVIVALTGWGAAEDKRRSQEAGFSLHATKPIPPDLLEAILNRHPGM